MWGNPATLTSTDVVIYQVTGSGNPGAWPAPPWPDAWICNNVPPLESEDPEPSLRALAQARYRMLLRARRVESAAPIDPVAESPVSLTAAPRRSACRASARGIRNWRRRPR